MPEKKFELGDYVEVKDRIKLFYELFGQGRLVTGEVRLTTEPDGVPRVMVQGLAYRSPDDPLPGVGWSWLQLPGSTPYTRGSEIENAETSAWGRAIGSLGILIDRSIASSQEVQNKAGESSRRPLSAGAAAESHVLAGVSDARAMTPIDGLIGTVEIAKDSPDFLPHIGPDGPVLTFKLVSGRGGIKIVAKGDLASALSTFKDTIVGQRATCYGHVRDETFTPKGSKRPVTYQVLDLDRIATSDYILPAPHEDSPMPEFDEALPEPPDDVELVAEAPSVPLGLVS